MTCVSDTPASSKPHAFAPSLLRKYDIRGIVGDIFSITDARVLGRAFGSLAKRRGARAIAVGHDGRHSSPALAEAFSGGVAASGLDVVG